MLRPLPSPAGRGNSEDTIHNSGHELAVLLDLRYGSIGKSGCSWRGEFWGCHAQLGTRIGRFKRTGRVLGGGDFQKRLEKKLGRVLRRQEPGPKRAAAK